MVEVTSLHVDYYEYDKLYTVHSRQWLYKTVVQIVVPRGHEVMMYQQPLGRTVVPLEPAYEYVVYIFLISTTSQGCILLFILKVRWL